MGTFKRFIANFLLNPTVKEVWQLCTSVEWQVFLAHTVYDYQCLICLFCFQQEIARNNHQLCLYLLLHDFQYIDSFLGLSILGQKLQLVTIF